MYNDWKAIKKLITSARQLCDEGGDWERKNKLKVPACHYTALTAQHWGKFVIQPALHRC